jgi:hypothetical protein
MSGRAASLGCSRLGGRERGDPARTEGVPKRARADAATNALGRPAGTPGPKGLARATDHRVGLSPLRPSHASGLTHPPPARLCPWRPRTRWIETRTRSNHHGPAKRAALLRGAAPSPTTTKPRCYAVRIFVGVLPTRSEVGGLTHKHNGASLRPSSRRRCRCTSDAGSGRRNSRPRASSR